MAEEITERKEFNSGRAILTWDTAVAKAARIRAGYAFWAGSGVWALWHLRPTADGLPYLPGSFGEVVWLVFTTAIAGAVAAGVVGLMAAIRKDARWLDDYWHEVTRITERAAAPEPPPSPPTRNSTGRPVFVPSNDGAIVEHANQRYRFSQRQLRLMQDRVESGELGVARDAFDITGADYATLRGIMSGLGYWGEDRGRYSWSDRGLAWLADQMRIMHV